MSVAAAGAVRAEALLVEGALDALLVGHVAERALGHLALHAPTALGHLGHVVLVQELAVVALHAQRAQPVAAHDRAALEVLLGALVAERGAAHAHHGAAARLAAVHAVVAVLGQQHLEVERQTPLLLVAQQQPQHHGCLLGSSLSYAWHSGVK